MKILLHIEHIVESAGGAEKVLCNMANELSLRGHQVTVVCYDHRQGLPFYPLMPEVKFVNLDASGQKEQHLGFKKIVRELTKPLRRTFLHPFFPDPVESQKLLKFSPRFRDFVRRAEPDIIISYFLNDHNRVIESIGHSRPLIVMHHNNPSRYILKASANKIASLRQCDCLQLLLPGFEKAIRAALPRVKTCVIPNVVDLVDEKNLANPGESKEEYIIIMIGRLCKRQKQQHFLIQSFSHLAKEYPQWKVHLYGGNARPRGYEDYLKTLIRKLKLENQVFLMGTTDAPLDTLRNSDIFAFPSATEGFGLALTEAMSVGLPCVGLKTTSAVNELIVDGYNGFLSDNNEQDFAQQLKRLMDDPLLRVTLGRNGHEFVKQFEPKKIWDQWENLITETVQEYQQRRTRPIRTLEQQT